MNGLPVCQDVLRCILFSKVLEVKDIRNCLFVCKQFLSSSYHLDFWLRLCKRYSYFNKLWKGDVLDWINVRKMFLCFYKNLNVCGVIVNDVLQTKEIKTSEELYVTVFMFDPIFGLYDQFLYQDHAYMFKKLRSHIKEAYRKMYNHVTFIGHRFYTSYQMLIIDKDGKYIEHKIMISFLKGKRVKVVLHLLKNVNNNDLLLSWNVLRIEVQ